ncbi:MAG TPA: hypothetical protein VNQ81_04395 [Povalibacter sp.]|nr:hypothetical protein [Povalibacter sp.]
MKLSIAVSSLLIACALAACGQSQQNAQQSATPAVPDENPAVPAPAAAPAADTAAIQAALSNPNRLTGDAEEDAWRKAPEVLSFLNVQPGMHVIDYLSGGGYYSELLASIVGPQGQVIAYNNPAYAKYAGEKVALRYVDNRLPNVTQITSPPEQLDLPPNSLDAALFVQSYHDLHWISKDWTPTDPAQSLAKLVPALKSGAVVVVVDHVANAGEDPAKTVDALHRIDPAVVKREFEAAGLVFDAESPMFSNTADDHSKVVFDPSIRHQTDQFVYRFRKP